MNNKLLLPLLLFCTSCQPPSAQDDDVPSMHVSASGCAYFGNVPGKPVCAVTYTQLLCDAPRYEGRQIKVLAFAQPGGEGRVALFPSRDSLTSGEGIASIVIENDPMIPAIDRYLSDGNPEGKAVPIYVTGTFSSSHSERSRRGILGRIHKVNAFGP